MSTGIFVNVIFMVVGVINPQSKWHQYRQSAQNYHAGARILQPDQMVFSWFSALEILVTAEFQGMIFEKKVKSHVAKAMRRL